MNYNNITKMQKIDYRMYKISPYSSREERAKFAYTEYSRYFGKSVLDVGGYRGGLGGIFPGKYMNIDMNDDADYVLNLDKIERLPFDDMEFDTIVCTDVLEHLENIHLIFDEICRVAGKSVIISMPNAWNNVRYIVGGFRSQFSKNRPRRLLDRHWTLPADRPLDHHRWFYSLSEADEMIRLRCEKKGFKLAEYNPHVVIKKGFSLNNIFRFTHQKLWSMEDFVNLYAWVGWWVLCRGND